MIALAILVGFCLFICYVWDDLSDLVADEIGADGDAAETVGSARGTTATVGADHTVPAPPASLGVPEPRTGRT